MTENVNVRQMKRAVSREDELFFGKFPETEMVPSYGKTGGLSHETIENIIKQKQQYFDFKREQDEVIWNDPDFRPGPLLDRIADRIALEMIKSTTELVEKTCDDFIDCLVHSEFFPDE